MSSVSVSEARATLPDLLDRVLAGEEVTLTRHGHPVAVLVRPDSLRSRRAERLIDAAARLEDRLERAASRPLAIGSGLSLERADELLADLRESRSSR